MFRTLRRWPAVFRALRSSQIHARPPRRARHHTLRYLPLEQLEGRLVLSAFHVSTLADGGPGSLRDAVAQANAHAGADTIDFQPGQTGTIALTGGELDLADDLAITGPGADQLTVSGSQSLPGLQGRARRDRDDLRPDDPGRQTRQRTRRRH